MNGGIKSVAREIAQERRAHRMAMLNSRTSRVAVSVVTALAGMVVVVGSGRGSTTQASAAQLSPKRVGHAPSASGRAVRLGGLSGKTVLHVDVELSPRDPAGLASFATAVSTPGNALYHHYLARGQLASRFGPTADAVTTVTNELHADGLTVGPISSNHQTIHVTASAARLAKAFSTSFETYRLSTGRIAYANTEAPLFSASAAPAVQGVIGLDNLSLPRPVGLERTGDEAPPCVPADDRRTAALPDRRYVRYPRGLHGEPARIGVQLLQPLRCGRRGRRCHRCRRLVRAELDERHRRLPVLLRNGRHG